MKLQFTEESRLARGPITNANVGNVILVWGEIIKKNSSFSIVLLLFYLWDNVYKAVKMCFMVILFSLESH